MSGEDPELEEPEEQEEPGRPVAKPAVPVAPLRRGLLGYRAKDVHAELEARRAEVEDLRRDVAALWLAFGQHERTIRHLIAAMEALEQGGGGAPTAASPRPDAAPHPSPPPPAPAPAPPPGPAPTPTPDPAAAVAGGSTPPAAPAPTDSAAEEAVTVPADVISAQLSDLDDVLAAIEQATRSLERTYTDEIAPGDEAEAEDKTETDEDETDEDETDGGEPGASGR